MRNTPRTFGHGELHLALLALLAKRPMHGYELMGELAERMGARYKPSPGSIYPAVSALHDEGLIDAEERGGRKVYRITSFGETTLARRLDDLTRLEDDLGVRFTDDSIESAIAHFSRRVRELAGGVDAATLSGVLEGTISTLEGLSKEGT